MPEPRSLGSGVVAQPLEGALGSQGRRGQQMVESPWKRIRPGKGTGGPRWEDGDGGRLTLPFAAPRFRASI